MKTDELAVVADLLRQAADALEVHAEISPVTYEQNRLTAIARRCRDMADAIAAEVLAR